MEYVEAALAADQTVLEVWVEAHRPVGHYHHHYSLSSLSSSSSPVRHQAVGGRGPDGTVLSLATLQQQGRRVWMVELLGRDTVDSVAKDRKKSLILSCHCCSQSWSKYYGMRK